MTIADSTMMYGTALTVLGYALLIILELAFIARAIIRSHRQPASHIAWVVVIATLPIFGILIYILFGETNIGRKRLIRARKTIESMQLLLLHHKMNY